MRPLIFSICAAWLLTFSTIAAEPGRASNLSFNGVNLGDGVDKVKEKRRTGQCDGKGHSLTECTIFDNAGIAYEINDGHIIRIEAKRGVATNAALPFGTKIGAGLSNTLKLSFPQEGAQAFVKPTKMGLVLIRMIREPKTDYEFELQLHFDNEGKLEGIVYKDII
jgi:hypothetical protein